VSWTVLAPNRDGELRPAYARFIAFSGRQLLFSDAWREPSDTTTEHALDRIAFASSAAWEAMHSKSSGRTRNGNFFTAAKATEGAACKLLRALVGCSAVERRLLPRDSVLTSDPFKFARWRVCRDRTEKRAA